RLLGVAQDLVRAHELNPSVDIGAVLLETLRQTLDHVFDRTLMLGRRRFRSRGARLVDACQRPFDEWNPARLLWRASQQRSAGLLCIIAPSVLLGRKSEIKLRHDVFAIERRRTLE